MMIKKIPYEETKDFILNKHYAQRMPSVRYAYGLFIDDKMEGVCTIGKPVSNSLCKGICGQEHSSKVWELNRLVINEGLPKNTLSRFVAMVMRDLKEEDIIIVSYADEGAGHFGYIYQASNFIYTGRTNPRTDKYVPDGKHSRHYTDKYNHIRKVRTPKHRYVFFTGKSKKKFLECLNYPILPYPKGDNTRYVMGEKIEGKNIDTSTGKVFYE